MTRRILKLAAAAASVLVLAACESARFGGGGPSLGTSPSTRVPDTGVVYNTPVTPIEPGQAAPAGSVVAEPLPPPTGSADPAAAVGGGPIIADVPATQIAPAPVAPAPVAVAAPAAPTRSSVVGSWTAQAAGSSCRVTLSSSPSLDLYRASSAGCDNKDLSGVSAWDLRDGEVYLYQRGGAVAARLRTGSGRLEGVLAKSGAPLVLSR